MKTRNNSIWYVCLSPTREAQQKHILSVRQGKFCPSKGAIHDWALCKHHLVNPVSGRACGIKTLHPSGAECEAGCAVITDGKWSEGPLQ